MKNLMIVCLLLLTIASTALAQQPKARYPQLRERIAGAKFEYIREKLALTDAQTERLRPIYLAFEKEQAQLGAFKKMRINNINADSISDQAAMDLINARFDFAQKQLDLRRKYLVEYQKVLSPQQLIKLQQTEAEIRQKVLMELKNRRQGGKFQ